MQTPELPATPRTDTPAPRAQPQKADAKPDPNKEQFHEVLEERVKADGDKKEAKADPSKDAKKTKNPKLIARTHDALVELASLLQPRPQAVELHHLRAKTKPKSTENKSEKQTGNKLPNTGKNIPPANVKVPLKPKDDSESPVKSKVQEVAKEPKSEKVPTEPKASAPSFQVGPTAATQNAPATPVSAHAIVAPPRYVTSTDHVQIKTNDRGGDAKMTLDLGDGVSLELRIQVRDGAANVVIQANRPELIHQLNTHRAELAQALQSAGLDPELMQFGSHDESNSHPQDEREHDEHFDHDEPTDEQTWDHIPGRLYIVT